MGEITPNIRAETVKALGEELAKLAGIRMTRITQAFEPSNTVAHVESTYDWPDAGIVVVEGLDTPQLIYTGKTATTLTGVVRDPYETQTADLYAVCVEWSRTYSDFERARADCYYDTAEGRALTLRARNDGIGRPGAWMSDVAFRRLAKTLAFLPNGPWDAVWQVCDAFLTDYHIRGTTAVNVNVIADPGGVFRLDHCGRYVRVTDTDGTKRIHRVRSVVAGSSLVLHTNGGPFWVGAKYSAGVRSWELLAFVHEVDADASGRFPCEVVVHAVVPDTLASPPNYLQVLDDADYAAVVPPALVAPGVNIENQVGAAGGDYAGYAMEDASDDGTTLVPGFPFYLPGGPESLQTVLEDVVPLGVKVTVWPMAA